ncbi:MAG: DUF2062 domain-containing protein [Verrucomicrobia bacterium]|nr:DUF2062 domain-containing protein [Verrucomicrobiota bacterium]
MIVVARLAATPQSIWLSVSDPSAPPNAPAEDLPSPPPPRNFFQRRVIDPIVAQLTQGLTPEKIALTIAVGSSIAMFPLLGTTTIMCLIVGVFMKLNQPIIQAVNYACTPIHIPFIYYSFKWGEKLFGVAHSRLEMRAMRRLLVEDPIQFAKDYGESAIHAVVVWAILVPFWGVAIYYLARPILREIARVKAEAAARAAAKSPEHPVP